jgi:hypothetical protein
MEPRENKHGPEVKAKALELLRQGKRPGEIGKELGISPLAVAAWRGQMEREKKAAAGETRTISGSAVVVHKVPDPGPDVGVPTGSAAGGAEGARAAAGAAPKVERVEAERVPPEGEQAAPQASPFAGIDPAEILIIISKFATSKLARMYCLTNDVEWDPVYGEWTEEEEFELRLTAPGAAMIIGEYLIKYGIWLAPILYFGALWEVMSVRAAAIKKKSPKRKGKDKEEPEDSKDDTVKYDAQPNGDVPVRSRAREKEVSAQSFWDDPAAMRRDRGMTG